MWNARYTSSSLLWPTFWKRNFVNPSKLIEGINFELSFFIYKWGIPYQLKLCTFFEFLFFLRKNHWFINFFRFASFWKCVCKYWSPYLLLCYNLLCDHTHRLYY
jgi:hypothetical protein